MDAGDLIALLTAWALTALGVVAGWLWPELAPGGSPHPTLHGTVADGLAILVANMRLLSVPFALVLLGFQRGRGSRAFGDVLVAAIVTENAIRVGLAIGRDRAGLIPYIPQLPIEWLALALSAGTWLTARPGCEMRRPLGSRAAQVLILLVAAAAVEVGATPHAR